LVHSYLKSGFHKVSELLLFHRHVILGQPVTEEDWSHQSSITIYVRKMLQSNIVYVLVCPLTLIIFDQPREKQKQEMKVVRVKLQLSRHSSNA